METLRRKKPWPADYFGYRPALVLEIPEYTIEGGLPPYNKYWEQHRAAINAVTRAEDRIRDMMLHLARAGAPSTSSGLSSALKQAYSLWAPEWRKELDALRDVERLLLFLAQQQDELMPPAPANEAAHERQDSPSPTQMDQEPR